MEIAWRMPCPATARLGVLAEIPYARRDIRLPMVAVSLLYRKGYFSSAWEDGSQTENRSSGAWRFLIEEAPA